MQDIKGFRRYYNDHLHARLVRFERHRYLLTLLIALVTGTLATLTLWAFFSEVGALLLFMAVPWWVGIQFLRGRIRHFKGRYKPMVIDAILKFIDPRFKYYHEAHVPQDVFFRSRLFPFEPQIYQGEDYIMGKIGEIFFEMSELEVHGWVGAKNQARLKKLFEGVFFHANFHMNFKGNVVVFPRADRQNFIRVVKDFVKYGGYEVKDWGDESFRKEFVVYTDPEVHYKEVLTDALLKTINAYHLEYDKKVYVSFVNSHLFIAIHEDTELLEAHVFTSNINFDLFCAFYDELYMFTRIVEELDIGH